MTLATRCSACGTSFRVVQDQLKVSGGWVRCGRCGEVFNAIEGLYEVGSPIAEPPPTVSRPAAVSSPSPAPARAPDPGPAAANEPPGIGDTVESPPAEQTRTAADGTSVTGDAAPISDLPPWPDEPVTPAPSSEVEVEVEVAVDAPVSTSDASPAVEDLPAHAAAEAVVVQPEPEPEAAESNSAETEQEAKPDPGLEREPVAEPAPDASPAAAPAANDWQTPGWGAREQVPSFLRKADRAARWQQPRVRRLLVAAALLLIGTLGLQAAIAYRDVLASRWPMARAPLLQACSWLGCRIEPPRHIAAMSVEASGLQQVGNAALYQLSIVLRNRGDIAVRAPALELVLSDAQGATVARKVLSLAELGRADPAIGAGTEWAGQAVIDVGGRRVSGYTIEIFYP